MLSARAIRKPEIAADTRDLTVPKGIPTRSAISL